MTRFRKFLFWCFAAYCAVLFAILFLRGLGGHYDFDRYPYWDRILDKINLIPFATIREQMNYITSSVYNRRVAIRNLAANLMLFVPMGFFLPMLFQRLRRFTSSIRSPDSQAAQTAQNQRKGEHHAQSSFFHVILPFLLLDNSIITVKGIECY